MNRRGDTAMPASTTPPAGGLRVLLPPNLPAAAGCDAVAVKICAAPETLPSLLQGVCSGRGPWLLSMRRAELRAVLHLLAGQPVFAWVNRPTDDLPWRDGGLSGVTEFLTEPENPKGQTPHAKENPSGQPEHEYPKSKLVPAAHSAIRQLPSAIPAAAAPVVDGSEHFLAITSPAREHPAYAAVLAAVRAAGFILEPTNRKWWLRDRHRTLGFLAEHWERLEREWGAQLTDNFRRNTARIRLAEVTVVARDQGDSLDVELALQAGGAPAEAIQAQLAQGRHYVETAGHVCLIAAATLAKLATAQRNLAGNPLAPLLQRSRHRVPRFRTSEVAETIEGLSPGFQAPETWLARSAGLRDTSQLAPAPIPPVLDRQLRNYQRLGAAWLWHLAQCELGGILADEMGLGKTAQALALLTALRAKPETDRCVALVVCPASLVENWRREAVRFAPELRVAVHHGAARLAGPLEFARCDLVITSYGTLVRDQARFAAVRFAVLIADEAQHAKNRRTQAAQALRAVPAAVRFCLTGTPVENSLEDLRSLFDLVLPGALAPVPADARGDERAWHEARLRRQTAPFILRRTKAQVAPELPPKIEQVIWCEPTETQRDFYAEVRTATERDIDALAAAGRPEGQVRLAVLTQLLRLRQVCCDPRLVAPAGADGPARFTAEDSAKLVAFREILDEALDDGHRLLVFSQFTSLLALVREELAAREVVCCYLDGSMSARARQAEVDRFQSDATVTVFLISLKAGGTGLNLTGADVVVHFDPWWNPAVEAQATDRAHRLGQTKVVTSYKLVVAGTVEEKVLQLQETKRRLLADVFEASDAANARLGLADLRALLHSA